MQTDPQLQLRKQALLLKIKAQRQLWHLQTEQFRSEHRLADMAQRVIGQAGDTLKKRPLTIGLGILALAVLKPGRALRLAQAGLQAWRLWQDLSASRTNHPPPR
jgi:hypothetical protein